ncbi:MAG: sensor domain-containing diguanylate cyclase [Evtepia sp.]
MSDYTPSDQIIPLDASLTYLKGRVAELEALVISERKNREALRISEEKYRLITEQSDDIVFEWEFSDNIIHFSEKYVRIFGTCSEEYNMLSNPTLRDKIHLEDLNQFDLWIEETYQSAGVTKKQFRIRTLLGKYIWVEAFSTGICDNMGVPIKAVGTFSDIDQQKNAWTVLELKSQLDPLTHLYNKIESRVKIEQFLAKKYKELAVLFIVDIDNFKAINDNLGHQFGDSVLQDVSAKVQRIFRRSDIIGRLGGDEIVIFMRECQDEQSAHTKATLLSRTLRATYYGSDSTYHISGSIGISFFPEHGTSFEELYRCADIALYESKAKGKDCYTIYHDHMTSHLHDHLTPVELTEGFLATYFKNDTIFNAFQMLYQTNDFMLTVTKVMEMIGNQFQTDRVYLFEFSSDRRFVSNTYEWCAQGVSSHKDMFQNLPIEKFQACLILYSDEGILCCNDITLLHTYAVPSYQTAQAFLHCAMSTGGRMNGFLGVDSLSKRVWRGDEIATLGYLARIFSVFKRCFQ